MRVLMIAAGLCVAATAASAATKLETVTRTDTNLTLNNGCVYAPNSFAQDGTWTFVHATAGAHDSCPLAVRLETRSAHFEPGYLVGVYR
ncbi:hypothetical protein [Tateyamaria sp. SN6-1]|uniref:hypothetical protein n=1 Tax=Tateyamaria sp. SN6-1 TaxID=3092148 RepID=UPI0039F61689